MEQAKKIVNWHELSRVLTGNPKNIRANNIPKKYENRITMLLKLFKFWLEY